MKQTLCRSYVDHDSIYKHTLLFELIILSRIESTLRSCSFFYSPLKHFYENLEMSYSENPSFDSYIELSEKI